MKDSALNTFHNLAVTAQRIAETKNTNAKIRICADYFRSIPDDDDLNLAIRFLGEGAFPTLSEKRISIGSRTISTCAARFCEISYERVFKPSKAALGNASETIEKLMHNIETARSKRSPQYLSLAQVLDIFEKLCQVSSRADKQEILERVWTRMTPVEIKYFIQIIRRGALRIDFEIQNIITALAKAFDKDEETVRYVHVITGSIGKTAVLCKNDRLDKANFKLFHPLPFMLASPVNAQEVESLDGYIAEEELNGLRCQAHISDQVIELYSHDLKDVTGSLPDVTRFLLGCDLPDLVLDGRICVFRDDKVLPSQLLQKRISLKKLTQEVLDKYPVLFIAYDLLYCDGQPVFKQTLTERRQLLETISVRYNLPVASQFKVNNQEEIDFLLERALKRGNNGLVLKDKSSTYEYGQRSKSWLKLKRPGGTLDTIIMYAHTSSGRQNGTFSHFTLGICVREDERYNENFIPVGKVSGSHIDEEEMERLNKRIEELAVEKYGPTLGLIPGIVVEAEFDDIQTNKRTKANYRLSRPRFKAVRWDLDPSDADTLKKVERMYHQKMERNRLKQGEDPSFLF